MKGKRDNFKSEIQRRLCMLAEALGISNREFSRKIGKSDNYIASMNIDITVGAVNNIYTAFPQTNLEFLVTGNGEALKPEPVSEELSSYLKTEKAALKKENRELLIEIGKLQGMLAESKKSSVRQAGHAGCADAKNLKLAK